MRSARVRPSYLPTTPSQLKTAKLDDDSLSLIDSLSIVFTPLSIEVARACFLSQCLLYLFFRNSGFHLLPKDSTWSRMPSYTAHQVIVLPLMVYLVWQGIVEWLSDGNSTTSQDRVLRGSYFSDIVVGIMLWDIPTTAFTPQLRNWPMMIHHVAMLVTAALSLGVCSNGTPVLGYYAPFFFGATEISTPPLVVMDVLKCHELPSPDWLGPLFAFLFLTTRAFYFPYVAGNVLFDIRNVTSNGIYPKALYSLAFLNMLFTILQLYWGILVVQGLIEAFS